MQGLQKSYHKLVVKVADSFTALKFSIKFPLLVSVLLIEILTFHAMDEEANIQNLYGQTKAFSTKTIPQPKQISAGSLYSLSALPKSSTYRVGDKISINLHLETGIEKINAAEILLNYPDELLEVDDILINTNAFDVQVKAENNEKTINVTVGSTKPRSGSVSIATIVFRAKEKGQASIEFDPTTQVLSYETHENILKNLGDTIYVIE